MLHNAHTAHPKKVFIIIAIISLIIVSIWFYLNNKNVDSTININLNPDSYIAQDTKLGTIYISTADTVWPPQVSAVKGKFECAESGEEVLVGGRTIKKVIAGKTYCITASSEGAAGSTYTTYQYKTLINGKIASINFVLRFPQCMNYDEPKQSECLAERQMFDPDGLANAIIENARL